VYDANNNLIGLTDAEGKPTLYTFDARNLRTQQTYANDDAILHTGINDRVSYTYDAANRVTSRKDQKNETISYTWDMAGRLATRSYPDAINDTFTFDNASRLLTATSARYGNTVTRTYDAAGRMTADNLTVGANTYNVGFGFDAANRSTSITYPDGSVVGRTYTDRNQLYQVNYAPNGGAASTIATRSYDDGWRLLTTAYGNGRVETRTYTANDNTTATIKVPSVTDFTYAYDPNKNKTTETDGILPNYSWTTLPIIGGSGYDDKDRLVNWSRTGGDTQTWNLTKEGNWASTVINGTTDVRTHNDVHQLITRSIGITNPLTYDPKGNLTTNSNGQTYTWDFGNKMTTATVDGATWTYAYDALGRRVSKSNGTKTTLFVSARNQEIAEYTNGSLSKKYAFGTYIDEPLAMINVSGTTETTYYYHASDQYSITAMTDSAGAVVERYVYSPYGKVTILDAAGTTIRPASIVGNATFYTGRKLDSETSLYCYRARYYDADQGRFISRDSREYIDSINMYQYVVGNPLIWLDPSGEIRWGVLFTGVAKVTLGIGTIAIGVFATPTVVTGVGAVGVAAAVIGGSLSTGSGISDIVSGFMDQPSPNAPGSIGDVAALTAESLGASPETSELIGDAVDTVIPTPEGAPKILEHIVDGCDRVLKVMDNLDKQNDDNKTSPTTDPETIDRDPADLFPFVCPDGYNSIFQQGKGLTGYVKKGSK